MLKAVPHIDKRAERITPRVSCKEIENRIPAFMANELDDRELTDFLRHVEHCDSCREELTIQFLVNTGMRRLEGGDTFNLASELNSVLNARKHDLTVLKRVKITAYAFETAAILFAAACVVIGVMLL